MAAVSERPTERHDSLGWYEAHRLTGSTYDLRIVGARDQVRWLDVVVSSAVTTWFAFYLGDCQRPLALGLLFLHGGALEWFGAVEAHPVIPIRTSIWVSCRRVFKNHSRLAVAAS